MKQVVHSILFLCLTIAALILGAEWTQRHAVTETSSTVDEAAIKRDLLCLMMAYPEHIIGVERQSEDKVFVVMKSGNKILYDDHKMKTFEAKMQNPDLQDMLEQIYPLDDISHLMDEDFDPGRIRVYALLKEVYGESKEAVQSNLVNVKIGYKNYMFNKNNNAAKALQNVMDQLVPLAQKRSDIYSCLFPINGTFNYRYIAGTRQLSAHAFGISIDLANDKRDYWKWASREEGEKRLSVYPREIVQIFEQNNFIWGGKWGHFDIMHFEYRPEIIIKSKYFSREPLPGRPWHDGVPKDDVVANCIWLIESAWQN
ncbi:MAG: M15 family metallopeptidase [Clostridiaceae bacterium]|nr:M15 family metallopeptidase [Clostridiaceae bacterium]